MYTHFHPRSPNPPKNRQRVTTPKRKHPALKGQVLKIKTLWTAGRSFQTLMSWTAGALACDLSRVVQPPSAVAQNVIILPLQTKDEYTLPQTLPTATKKLRPSA
jgi:hypothetical protein